MKKSIVATLIIGIVAVSATAAACTAPAYVASVTPATEERAAPQIPDTQVQAVSDLERVEVMQSSNGMLINDYLNRGQEVPEYIIEQNREIEQAKQALRQLDGQQEALSMLVVQYCSAGAAIPDCVFDLIDGVQQSRDATLKEIGLY